jgi:hypothetical protein
MTLDTVKYLHFMTETARINRILRARDVTMTYGELARHIGLIDLDDAWNIGCLTPIIKIINATADAARLFGDTAYDVTRFVNGVTGEPGAGAQRWLDARAA